MLAFTVGASTLRLLGRLVALRTLPALRGRWRVLWMITTAGLGVGIATVLGQTAADQIAQFFDLMGEGLHLLAEFVIARGLAMLRAVAMLTMMFLMLRAHRCRLGKCLRSCRWGTRSMGLRLLRALCLRHAVMRSTARAGLMLSACGVFFERVFDAFSHHAKACGVKVFQRLADVHLAFLRIHVLRALHRVSLCTRATMMLAKLFHAMTEHFATVLRVAGAGLLLGISLRSGRRRRRIRSLRVDGDAAGKRDDGDEDAGFHVGIENRWAGSVAKKFALSPAP